jgi:hypothetical protein
MKQTAWKAPAHRPGVPRQYDVAERYAPSPSAPATSRSASSTPCRPGNGGQAAGHAIVWELAGNPVALLNAVSMSALVYRAVCHAVAELAPHTP